jgi:hypothetical protein
MERNVKMTKKKKRKQQQTCKVMQTIDKIEEAAATAAKIFRAVQPIAKAILTHGRKTR